MKKNILVTGVGGPTPRSFVRAVKLFGGEAGKEFDFIGVDCNPRCYGLYAMDLFSKTFIVPRADAKNYWEKINQVIEENEIEGAIILPEVEVLEWAKNSGNLKKKIKLHLPDYNLAKKLINKHTLHLALKDSDYIPKFFQLNPEKYSNGEYSYSDLTKTVGENFWIRATEGSSGLGSLKITSEESLKQWLSINPGVKEFIASEFLPGRNMACKLLYFNGRLIRTACAERVEYIMAKVAPSGITGNTSFGRLLNEPQLVEISVKAIEKIAAEQKAGLHGIFTVDYKEDADGNPKITEINIRHVAFTSSIAAGGANLPMDTLKALFIENPDNMEVIHYKFNKNLIFLRDVDSYPIVMEENELKKVTVD